MAAEHASNEGWTQRELGYTGKLIGVLVAAWGIVTADGGKFLLGAAIFGGGWLLGRSGRRKEH